MDTFFSLIVPTLNRNKDLFRLLYSLCQQTYSRFELIIVDQNKNSKLSDIDYASIYNLNVKVVKPGKLLCASSARNYGILYAKGDIITFPDDDCWYEKNVLKAVNTLFDEKKVDVITGRSIDPITNKTDNAFIKNSKIINSRFDIPKAGVEYSIFIKKNALSSLVGFDENISPGALSIFQSGEAMDLLLRSLSLDHKIYFEQSLVIYHPYKGEPKLESENSYSISFKKHFKYATGFGYVLFKNKQHILLLYYLLRSLGALTLSFTCFNLNKIKWEWYNLKGRLIGYIKGFSFQVKL